MTSSTRSASDQHGACAEALFAGAVRTRAAHLALHSETPLDSGFLDDLSTACSPLAGMLPDAMIRQQAAFQRIGYDAAFPTAMRRLVMIDGQRIGRVSIDWSADASHCIDIAVLPPLQRHGIGTALLSGWLSVAERLRVPATLCVRPDNAAIALYRRLGFVPAGDEGGPMLTMAHPR